MKFQAEILKEQIIETPDFPKPGILFRDISPLLSNPSTIELIAKNLIKDINLATFDCFAGIESRGFILAMLLATYHKKGFLPIRKAGKLPPPIVSESYSLEYGEATIEMKKGRGSIVIVDDVLATGGTLHAAISVAQKAGFTVIDVVTLINLKSLNTMKYKDLPIKYLIEY